MKKDKETAIDIEVNHSNHYNQKNHSSDKKGWEIKKLGEVCGFSNGLWTGKKPPFQKVGVIRNTNFTKEGKLDDSDIVYLDVEQTQFAKRKLLYGDIILEKSGGGPKQPVGRVIIFDKKKGDFSFSNFTSVIRILNRGLIDFNYLHRFLFFSYISGITEKMQSHSTGIRNLKFDDYKNIEIPLPPLHEQQRVVAILDEAFAVIAKAKANAEQNLKNAKELFESYLQGVFENKGEGWEEKTLEELADETCTLSYGIVQPGNEYPNGLPIIRPTDLTRRLINLDGLKRINPKLADGYKRTKLTGNELLLCVRGSTGVVSIALKELEGANVTRGIVPIRFNSKLINQDFGYYLLISNYIQKQIKAKTYGTALMQINIGDLRKILTPFPSLKEQQAIVKKLDALSTETKKLEAIYQKKTEDLEELKKAVLEKAFRGELIKENALA